MKKKLDDLTKMKLFYSGELIIIAIALIVIGSLQLARVMMINDIFRQIFNWVTIFGAIFIIGSFFFSYFNEKRRKKMSLFDKFSLFPLAVYLIVIDIILFINYQNPDPNLVQTLIPIALLMCGIIYLSQGIYHWYYPLPTLLMELEQERIDKITYQVKEKDEEGNVKALHIESNKMYLFKAEDHIKEGIDELFCLDLYPNATPIEINEDQTNV